MQESRDAALGTKLGISVGTNNLQAAKDAEVILIGVKPQVVEEVVAELRGHISPRQLIISVATSVPNGLIEKTLDSAVPVIRDMPTLRACCAAVLPLWPKENTPTPIT